LRLRALFVAADGRPQAPWRIIIFFVVAGFATMAMAGVGSLLTQPIFALTGSGEAAQFIFLVGGFLIAHAVMLRFVDKRPWSYLGLGRDAARPVVFWRGILLGGVPMLFPSALLLAIGFLSVRQQADGSSLRVAAQLSLVLLPAALWEELLSRGYLFATLGDWLGPRVALVATSVGFGLLHIPNPGSDARSVFLVTLAGFFLGAVLLVTRSLYAAWMAHWTWNWVMAVAMHSPVSGTNFPAPDYRIVDSGPDWITGGAWGPEGGAAAAAGMIAGLIYLYWRFNNKRSATADPSTPMRAPAQDDK
jgi:membrane protease YdiL (CAAX protease family)